MYTRYTPPSLGGRDQASRGVGRGFYTAGPPGEEPPKGERKTLNSQKATKNIIMKIYTYIYIYIDGETEPVGPWRAAAVLAAGRLRRRLRPPCASQRQHTGARMRPRADWAGPGRRMSGHLPQGGSPGNKKRISQKVARTPRPPKKNAEYSERQEETKMTRRRFAPVVAKNMSYTPYLQYLC